MPAPSAQATISFSSDRCAAGILEDLRANGDPSGRRRQIGNRWRRGQVSRPGGLPSVDSETLLLVSEYTSQFRFVLDDLSGAGDDALRGRSLTAVAAAGLMLLARGRSGPSLMDDLRRWLDVLGEVAAA